MGARSPRLRPLPVQLGLVGCVLLVVVLAGLWWTGRSDGRFHLIVPAQSGDGILLKGARGEIALLDGGSDGEMLASWLGRALPLGRRHIDLLVLTRADDTTLPGQLAAVRRYTIGRAVLVQPAQATPQWTELLNMLEAQGTPVHQAVMGDQLLLGADDDPLQAQITVLAAEDGRLLLQVRTTERRILLLQSAGTTPLPDVLGNEPVSVLVVPWERRLDDPTIQRLLPETIIFGEQPGDDLELTMAERRLGTARLLHERIDGEIDVRIDTSGMQIATSAP